MQTNQEYEKEVKDRYDKFLKKPVMIHPERDKYKRMKSSLAVMEYLRRIPKLFADFNMGVLNNRKTRGK